MTDNGEPRPGGEVVVYEAPDGEVALDTRLEQETVWLTRESILCLSTNADGLGQRQYGGLIHDVLCLANAEHDGPRFLVSGVEDGGASVQSIEDDGGRRTQAAIVGLFRDNAE